MELPHVKLVDQLIMMAEICMAGYIIYMGIKEKRLMAALFSAAATAIALWLELSGGASATGGILVDRLTVLMILIVGIVGSLICVYAVGYMEEFHKHHTDMRDRRGTFFLILNAFMSAMFGLVLFNNLLWMFFCWEATTLCSFLLIRYTGTKEAKANAMNALTINAGGGLAFAVGMLLLWQFFHVMDFESILGLSNQQLPLMVPIYLLGLAALTKSAQLPFSNWLIGAMVAPTPTSAMLHSSTMVKAGVFLLIRISPLLGDNYPGITFLLIGGFTFLMAAVIAVSKSDGKAVLAYSTISNLGLIVACASIGSAESIWAAVMLLVFHAIAKSLLFLSVGSAEHKIGSRNVEDMDGLVSVSGTLTMLMVIGIAGMFLAPFGMLISKWAAMKAFIDSGNLLIVLAVAFGSSMTLFFWTKWLGKLIGNYTSLKPSNAEMNWGEKAPLFILAFLVVAVCLGYPLVSSYIIMPFLEDNKFLDPTSPISHLNNTVVLFMLSVLFVLPLLLIPIYKRNRARISSVYMSGQNTGDNKSFYGSMGQVKETVHRNWYMEKLFGEKALFSDSQVLAWVMLAIGAAILAAMAVFKIGGS
jgi:ech hydrogenase subunit A